MVIGSMMWVVWLDTIQRSPCDRTNYTFGTLRAAMEISALIRRELGEEAEQLPDTELRSRLKSRKAGMRFTGRERFLEDGRLHNEVDPLEEPRATSSLLP